MKRCHACGSTDLKAATYDDVHEVGGRKFVVTLPASRCAKCGELRIHG